MMKFLVTFALLAMSSLVFAGCMAEEAADAPTDDTVVAPEVMDEADAGYEADAEEADAEEADAEATDAEATDAEEADAEATDAE